MKLFKKDYDKHIASKERKIDRLKQLTFENNHKNPLVASLMVMYQNIANHTIKKEESIMLHIRKQYNKYYVKF